jgi:hypothetical protein
MNRRNVLGALAGALVAPAVPAASEKVTFPMPSNTWGAFSYCVLLNGDIIAYKASQPGLSDCFRPFDQLVIA